MQTIRNTIMIKTIKHNLALKLDLLGFSASAICAVHCALMPFIIVFLPLMGLQFIANPAVEYFFIAASLIIGSFTFKHGYFNHHKKIYPFMIFLSGFTIILIGHFFFHNHSHEVVADQDHAVNDELLFLMIAPIGAFIIAISHLINRRLSKTPKVCCVQENNVNPTEQNITTEKQTVS